MTERTGDVVIQLDNRQSRLQVGSRGHDAGHPAARPSPGVSTEKHLRTDHWKVGGVTRTEIAVFSAREAKFSRMAAQLHTNMGLGLSIYPMRLRRALSFELVSFSSPFLGSSEASDDYNELE